MNTLLLTLLLGASEDFLPSWLRLSAHAEIGTLAVFANTYKAGSTGNELNYTREGAQNTLTLFWRVSAEAEFAEHHQLVLLYQPFDLRTQAKISRDLLIDGTLFPADTPVDFRYGFDFYRISYMYDFFSSPDLDVAIGVSVQLRNAVITFTSADGALRVNNENLGVVPLVKGRLRYTFDNNVFLGFEIDGLWASGRIITGSTNDFEGALIDTSLRAGVRLTKFAEAFANIRFLGGGARGREEDEPSPTDGFTNNWLWTGSLSLGVSLR